jgi:hypothetical protein
MRPALDLDRRRNHLERRAHRAQEKMDASAEKAARAALAEHGFEPCAISSAPRACGGQNDSGRSTAVRTPAKEIRHGAAPRRPAAA